jgi:phage minor structural protein
MMVRYNQLNTIRYNRVGKVRYNDRADLVPVVPSFYDRLAKARPVILDEDGKVLAVLENARDVIISEEINGEHTLTFTLPFNDSKRQYVCNERHVRVVDREYVIRRINIIRPESGSISVEVYCEATWYELKYSEPMTGVTEWTNEVPRTVLQAILAGTDWSLGEVEISTRRDFSVNEQLTNRLSALWEVPEIWGGELEFDTDKRVIHLREQIGGDPGVAIMTGKNMRSMESEISTEELATRLYPYGKNKLTIRDVNQGKEYVENFQYTDKVKVKIFHDERFTNPFHLKEKAEEILAEISKPRESYIVKALDLSFQTGLSHETFKLGDKITTYDKDLGVFIKTRIVRWDYNVVKPWETDLELSAKSPDLRDLLDHVKDVAGQLESADTIDRTDMLNLMVFNYLMNSRAEEGFSHWSNVGWEVDATRGKTGTASFKCVGSPTQEKFMEQVVYPSNRENYVISFEADVTGVTKTSNTRIGIEVEIEYEDGSTEVKFLPLA